MIWNRHLAVFAASNGAMAVALGAFAAHGAGPQIKSLLTTGASYQLTHALLALFCAIAPLGWPGGWPPPAAWSSASRSPSWAGSVFPPWAPSRRSVEC